VAASIIALPNRCRTCNSGLEELSVNRVQHEGQHDRTPLFDCVMVSRLCFGTISRPPENGFAKARAAGSSDQSAGASAAWSFDFEEQSIDTAGGCTPGRSRSAARLGIDDALKLAFFPQIGLELGEHPSMARKHLSPRCWSRWAVLSALSIARPARTMS
jgi:hypothetical protein